MINSFPSDMESQQLYVVRYDYDVSNNVIYSGFALRGATASDMWYLSKYTVDGSNNTTLIERGYDTWTDRASATYA